MSPIVGRVSGVTPICWTASVTPATVGVPSPQPLIGRVAVTLATVASVLGSVKVASTIGAGVLALDRAVKLLDSAGDRQVGDGGGGRERDDLRAAVVVDGDRWWCRRPAWRRCGCRSTSKTPVPMPVATTTTAVAASRRPNRWWP